MQGKKPGIEPENHEHIGITRFSWHTVPMGSPLARVRPLIVHILILVALATMTNASAIAPDLMGRTSTIPLAALTLVAAALESTMQGMVRRTIPAFHETPEETEVIRTHVWACGLAALVAVASVGFMLLA